MKRHRPEDRRANGPLRRSKRLRTTSIKAATPNLCEYCTTVKITYSDSRNALYSHKLGDVVEAANRERNCALCSFLTHRIRFPEEFIKSRADAILSLSTRVCTELFSRSRRPTQLVFKLNHSEPYFVYDVCKLMSEPTARGLGNFDGKYPEPHLDTHDGELQYMPRVVHFDPLSEATIGLVKDWLLSCRSHAFCRAQESRPLPTRVIDVRTDNPKIVDNEGLSGLYVALSHCWGSVKDTFSTTAQNIEERKNSGIELTQQPANFRHAVVFTRRLGFDYLWIDSLCILQRDVQDWRHEAGRMAGYYNNAVLTLAIADAINCNVGFLHDRYHHYSPPIPGDDGEFYCLREVLPQAYDLNVSSWISKRAWTLQERLLSPRVLYFTRDQLLWHCREDEWAEGDVYDFYRSDGGFCGHGAGYFIDRTEYEAYWRNKSSSSADKISFDTDFAARTWYNCVSEFSSRSLTRASDKLAAIGGLANMFCQPELGRYLAGLWERDLFRGMAWKRVEPALGTRERYRSYVAIKAKKNLVARDYMPILEYRAPSWSWASVNGPVEVDSFMFYSSRLGFSPEMQYEVGHWKTHCGPSLVSCNLLHSSDNSYVDTLEGSFIEVCGFYRKLWISRVKLSTDADGPDGPFIKDIVFDKDAPEQMYAYLSQPDELDRVWKELLMFQICKQNHGDRLVYALLLEKTEDPDSFKRVGLVELACYNLCGIPKRRKRTGVSFTYFLHPADTIWTSITREHYKTKEWQKDRWF